MTGYCVYMINNLIDGCLKIWNFSSSVEHFIFWRLFHQRLLVSNSRLLEKPEKFPDLVNWNGGTPMLLVSCGRWASGLCECFLCVNLPIMSTWCEGRPSEIVYLLITLVRRDHRASNFGTDESFFLCLIHWFRQCTMIRVIFYEDPDHIAFPQFL